MAQPVERTRRTANLRTRGRAAGVVQRVFSATAEELSRVGYAAMRVEDVAARSGVNKTTIYRRWPTKAELVAATMIEHGKQRTVIDTSTLRGDLRASLLGAFQLKRSEQGMLRIMQMERAVPEVEELARRFRHALERMRLAMVHRGIARGELPKEVDAQLVVDLVSAPTQRALLFNEMIVESYIDRVLDVVLAGAAACASKAQTTSAKRKRVRVRS
jgi:AcrR family transcriptional regulator